MTTVDEKLRHVRLKVERAKCHIADLNRNVASFLDSKPYRVAVKEDPQAGQRVHYIAEIRDVPDCLALIAGDAIQNLMSSLDHLAFQIVCSDSNGCPPNPNWIYFPIQDTFDKYESKKRGKIEGASETSISAIDALKPYQGGNDALWEIYRLNNIEKHRLIVTTGSLYHSVG